MAPRQAGKRLSSSCDGVGVSPSPSPPTGRFGGRAPTPTGRFSGATGRFSDGTSISFTDLDGAFHQPNHTLETPTWTIRLEHSLVREKTGLDGTSSNIGPNLQTSPLLVHPETLELCLGGSENAPF
jgi:hypothetical protein